MKTAHLPIQNNIANILVYFLLMSVFHSGFLLTHSSSIYLICNSIIPMSLNTNQKFLKKILNLKSLKIKFSITNNKEIIPDRKYLRVLFFIYKNHIAFVPFVFIFPSIP